jgi:hypothetical protein
LLILPAVVLPGISFSSFLVTSPIQSVPEWEDLAPRILLVDGCSPPVC